MAHCENYNYITLAAGASASKSFDVADIGILFWYANPKERNVTVASVTMASLLGRVWGYLTAHMKEMKLKLPYKYYKSKPPSILYEDLPQGKNKIDEDTLHGIFAVTARVGDDDQAIATWIGKHPKDKILVILDECTDMPITITNATPNLNSHPEKFQLIGIGNSNSTLDLHGILSTPKAGWKSVSTELQTWTTTQLNGICLYFNPYESPAITHPDPEMRKILGRFLISEKILKEKEEELGVDSDKFHRWVKGFWKSKDFENVVVTEAVLRDRDFYDPAGPEWSGFYPLQKIAGLDPSFSTGGDKCIFRVGTVGHTIDNTVKIDFHKGATTHEIVLRSIIGLSLEKQVALETVRLMAFYKIPIFHLVVDVTGQGRALGEVIAMVNEQQGFPLGYGIPLKIYSMSPHNLNKHKKAPPDILPFNSFLLWDDLRQYVYKKNIINLDEVTKFQLSNRRIITEEARGKYSPQRLESKLEYKRRMAALGNPHSPDQADAAALLIQGVKIRLKIEPGTVWQPPPRNADQSGLSRMVAHLEEHASKKQAGLPEADFSGSLHSYMLHSKPF